MNPASPSLTPCEDCDNVHEGTRKQHPGKWLCVRFPRLENLNAVAPKFWVRVEPYNRCVNINLGHCPLWVERRTKEKQSENIRGISEQVPEG